MYGTIAPFTPGPLPYGSAQAGITDSRPTWGELQTAQRAREREHRVARDRARLARRYPRRIGLVTWLLSLVGR